MGKEPSHGCPCPSCQNQFVIVDSVHNTKRVRKYDEYPCKDCSVLGWNHYTPSQEFKKIKASQITVKLDAPRVTKIQKKRFSFD